MFRSIFDSLATTQKPNREIVREKHGRRARTHEADAGRKTRDKNVYDESMVKHERDSLVRWLERVVSIIFFFLFLFQLLFFTQMAIFQFVFSVHRIVMPQSHTRSVGGYQCLLFDLSSSLAAHSRCYFLFTRALVPSTDSYHTRSIMSVLTFDEMMRTQCSCCTRTPNCAQVKRVCASRSYGTHGANISKVTRKDAESEKFTSAPQQ